jgi:hypothetical protein
MRTTLGKRRPFNFAREKSILDQRDSISFGISSAMLVRESRTSSANRASGRHDRHDSAGMRLVTAASWCRSSVRKSIALMVWQAGHRTHRPIPRGDSSADCRREQHWRPEGLALVPGGNQAVGILKHLSVGRTPVRRFLFRGLTALIL